MAEPTQDESSTIHSDQVQVIEKPKAFDPQDVGISLTKPQLILTFIGIAICLFLAALDTTIVSTAIPRISSDFHALEQGSWIATAYMLSFDALQVRMFNFFRLPGITGSSDVQKEGFSLTKSNTKPLHGKLSDIFGRRNVLLASVAIFLLGSVLCAVSKNMIMLIIMRALQGAGGSGCFCIVMIVIADVVPLRERGKYQAIANAVFAMASVLGPLLGRCMCSLIAFLAYDLCPILNFNHHFDTDTNALIGCLHRSSIMDLLLLHKLHILTLIRSSIPFGVVGAILIAFALKEEKKNIPVMTQLKRIDYPGTIVILIMATLILLGLNMGGVTHPWNSAPVLASLIVGVLFIGVFVLVEHKFAKEPIVPLRLFRKRTVVFVCIMQFFFGLAFNSVVIELPLFLQAARGDSAMMSGVRLIVSQAAISSIATLMGWVMSHYNTYKPILMCGLALVSTGVGLLALLTDSTPDGMLYGFLVVFGAGSGMVFACANVAIQSACDSSDLASVTALGMFIQNLGSAIGIAVCSTVVNNSLSSCLHSILPLDLATEVTESTTFIRSGTLTPTQQSDTIHCYVSSFKTAWCVVAALAAVGFLATIFIKQYSLIKPSGTRKHELKETVLEEPQQHEKNN